MYYKALLLFCLLFVSGCISSGSERLKNVQNIASKFNLKYEVIKTSNFELFTFYKSKKNSKDLTVYLEGDGFAWVTVNQKSSNPTPLKPMLLNLAMLDNNHNVAYLARPCQYIGVGKNPLCENSLWTSHRFSEVIIASMNQAINKLKVKAAADNIHLVGYSGGAAVAAIIAARRDDIKSIKTIAGNLDHKAVNKHHGVTLMPYSLNPINYAVKIRNIPQHHLVGEQDEIILPKIAQKFIRKGKMKCAKTTVHKNVSHFEGWETVWQKEVSKQLSCD